MLVMCVHTVARERMLHETGNRDWDIDCRCNLSQMMRADVDTCETQVHLQGNRQTNNHACLLGYTATNITIDCNTHTHTRISVARAEFDQHV